MVRELLAVATGCGVAAGAIMSRLYLRPPEPTEDELHEAVVQLLNIALIPPAEWCCYPAGHIPLPPRWAAKLFRMGLQPSWPDFLVVHGGQIIGIELKVGMGELSRTRIVRTKRGGVRVVVGQEAMHKRLRAAGMKVFVCRSTDAVLEALADCGVPLRVLPAMHSGPQSIGDVVRRVLQRQGA